MNHYIWALIAFILMFVGLWSAEHQNRTDLIAGKRVPARHATGDMARVTKMSGTAGVAEAALRTHQQPKLSVRALPLPAEIPPGWYRLLDSQGHVALIELTTAQLGPQTATDLRTPRDFYVSSFDGQHWIYETIQTPAHIDLSQDAPNLTLMDFPNFGNASYPTGDCLETGRMVAKSPRSATISTAINWLTSAKDRFFTLSFSQIKAELLDRFAGLSDLSGQMRQQLDSRWNATQRTVVDWLKSLQNRVEIAVPQPTKRAF